MSNIRAPIANFVREKVKSRFDGRCGYCGRKPLKLVIDHIHPVADERISRLNPSCKGDVNHEENLMPACIPCNSFKMANPLEVFRNELSLQVERGLRKSVNFRLAERYGQVEITKKPIQFYFEKDNHD